MTNKKIILLVICLSLIVFLMNIVFAFGIAGSNGPFTVSPGETSMTSFRLQNMIGGGDITVQADITQGSEVASIVGDNKYLVKFGTKDTEIPIRIRIPSDVPLGKVYSVIVSIRTVTTGGETGVGFGTAIDQNFEVLVVPETEEKKPFNPLIIVVVGAGILIAVGAAVFLMKKKKVKKRG